MVRSREWEKQGQETGGAGEGQEQVSGERWALPSASSGEAGVQEPWEAGTSGRSSSPGSFHMWLCPQGPLLHFPPCSLPPSCPFPTWAEVQDSFHSSHQVDS